MTVQHPMGAHWVPPLLWDRQPRASSSLRQEVSGFLVSSLGIHSSAEQRRKMPRVTLDFDRWPHE